MQNPGVRPQWSAQPLLDMDQHFPVHMVEEILLTSVKKCAIKLTVAID